MTEALQSKSSPLNKLIRSKASVAIELALPIGLYKDRCFTCHGTHFWYQNVTGKVYDGTWICSICHPKPKGYGLGPDELFSIHITTGKITPGRTP